MKRPAVYRLTAASSPSGDDDRRRLCLGIGINHAKAPLLVSFPLPASLSWYDPRSVGWAKKKGNRDRNLPPTQPQEVTSHRIISVAGCEFKQGLVGVGGGFTNERKH